MRYFNNPSAKDAVSRKAGIYSINQRSIIRKKKPRIYSIKHIALNNAKGAL